MCELVSQNCAGFHLSLNILFFLFITAIMVFDFSQIKPSSPKTLLLLPLIPLIFFSLETFARAGGGSHERCGWVCIVLYPFIIIYSLYANYRINQRRKAVSKTLAEMAKREPQWAEDNLLRISREQFMKIQTAWGEQDFSALKSALHPTLYPSWEVDLNAQKARGERNIMSGLSVNNLRIVGVGNYIDDQRDTFTVCIDARADDQIIQNNQVIKTDDSKFREFWTFEWHNGAWALLEVTQASGWKRFVSSAIIYENRQNKKVG